MALKNINNGEGEVTSKGPVKMLNKLRVSIENNIDSWAPIAIGVAFSILYKSIASTSLKRKRNNEIRVRPSTATTPNGRKRWIKNRLRTMSPANQNKLVSLVAAKSVRPKK